MSARILMLQGTGSDVGKSTLVAGLCRAAQQRGLRVAPFKPQNMSNNAAACPDGGEIGRAQALQAQACGLALSTDFNPVLLKPQSNGGAQVVVQGQVLYAPSASECMHNRPTVLLQAVLESFYRLVEQYDLVLVEGAGSASEVNLRHRDIANMGFAEAVGCPVCLVGDIDRGGVIAAIAGTQAVLSQSDAALINSFIINRFRGDPTLFEEGVAAIETVTSWPCRGVVPWLPEAMRLPQEDAVVLETGVYETKKLNRKKLFIAVPMLSHISNFDDLDPLRAEAHVTVTFVSPGMCIPRDVDAVIIPGTKSTLADLAFLRQQGWDHDIIALARNGVCILGICGGYQILGKRLSDPTGIEGEPASSRGLGLLNVSTEMSQGKTVQQVQGVCARSGLPVSGYEIHIGSTQGDDTRQPMLSMEHGPNGAVSKHQRVEGTYLHGLFSSDAYRSWWLESIREGTSSTINYNEGVERDIDKLAASLENALDVGALFSDARIPRQFIGNL